MSYRLIDANLVAESHPEINDMPCIYADLPRGLDGGHYDMREMDELQADNAKLRELVRMMWKPFCWAQSGYDVCLTDEQDRAIRDMVRELGVEVDG